MIEIPLKSSTLNKLSSEIFEIKKTVQSFGGRLHGVEISRQVYEEIKNFEEGINEGCNWHHQKDVVNECPFPDAVFFLNDVAVYIQGQSYGKDELKIIDLK